MHVAHADPVEIRTLRVARAVLLADRMSVWKNILLATDFSESAEPALALALQLTRDSGAALTLVHTWELPAYAYPGLGFAPADVLTGIESAARSQLEELLGRVRKEVPHAKAVLCRGFAADEIVREAERSKSDLIVIGTHGRRGVAHVVLGSVAERVVRTSPVPVLTVRPPH